METQTRPNLIRKLGLVVFVLALAYVGYRFLRPNPLTQGAAGMLDAMRSGDGNHLLNYTIAEERTCSGLDGPKLRKAWEILIQPIITSSTYAGTDKPKLEGNQTQAAAAAKYLDKQGNPWKLTVIANQAEEGPKMEIIYLMLATASLFDETGNANATLTPDLALKGIHRYR